MKLIIFTVLLFNINILANSDLLSELLDEGAAIRKEQYPVWQGGEYCPAIRTIKNREDLLNRAKLASKKLSKINQEQLSEKEQVDFEILKSYLTANLIGPFSQQSYLINIDHQSGYHLDYFRLTRRKEFVKKQDYHNYLACLDKFPDYTNNQIQYLKLGLNKGVRLSKVPLELFNSTLDNAQITFGKTSFLYRPFVKMSDNLSENEKNKLRSLALDKIKNKFMPHFLNFKSFFRTKYLNQLDNKVSISEIISPQYYKTAIKDMTSLDLDPDEIHQLGLKEVSRIKSEMIEVKNKANFSGTLKDFFKFLREDEQFYAKTEDELVKEVTYIMKLVDFKITSIFNKIPRTPYSFDLMPEEIAKTAPTAYASMRDKRDPNGLRTGIYTINSYDLKSRPLYNLRALTLHEAHPGHLFHGGLMDEMEDVHEFRKLYMDIAMGEGWGLYAESLGIEMGLYENPYDDFGRLNFEIWRAIRLVVDTGIHHKSWSRERAINYMLENSSIPKHDVITEIDRYIAWPGQALAYKTGELVIKNLRKEVKDHLGENFNIRQFHDAIFEFGELNLETLEKVIRKKFSLESPNIL